jgi:hypothetical protein
MEWVPVVKPGAICLGWGGDTWWTYQPWGDQVYAKDYEPLVAKIKEHTEAGQTVLLNVCWVPQFLWDNETYTDNFARAGGAGQTVFTYLMKGYTRPPKDYDLWKEILQDLVLHLNGTDASKGQQDLGVIFQIGNEPNTTWFWNAGFNRTQKFNLLLEYYEETARAIKEVTPHSLVGGPTLSMQHSTTWLQDDYMDWTWTRLWIEHCAANSIPVDFISWHYYLYPSIGKNRVTNYKEMSARIRNLIAANPGIRTNGMDPRLFVTEWAYYWSPQDIPATTFNAAYVAQSWREMMNSGIEIGCYTSAMTQFTGGVDPVVPAFMMFLQLGPERVLGETLGGDPTIGVIASRDGNRAAIMVSHYPFQQPAEEAVTKTVTLSLENMLPGKHFISRSLVDENHIGTNPVLEESRIIESDGSVDITFNLAPYGVSLLKFSPVTSGFPDDDNGWIDTGDWLGWIYVRNQPWIWVEKLNAYLFIPDATTPGGIWAWVLGTP